MTDLRIRRTAPRISQSRLARLSGVSRFKICLHELGDKTLSTQDIARVSSALQQEARRLHGLSAPIAAGVFGGVTGGGTDALVALFRTLGLNVFQSAFAQGLTSDPLDKTISYTVVFLILAALPVSVRTMFSHGEETVAE